MLSKSAPACNPDSSYPSPGRMSPSRTYSCRPRPSSLVLEKAKEKIEDEDEGRGTRTIVTAADHVDKVGQCLPIADALHFMPSERGHSCPPRLSATLTLPNACLLYTSDAADDLLCVD